MCISVLRKTLFYPCLLSTLTCKIKSPLRRRISNSANYNTFRKLKLSICIILFPYSVSASVTLTASPNTAVVGESLTLTCSHNEASEPIQWFRGGTTVAFIKVDPPPCGLVTAASTPGVTDRYSYTCDVQNKVFTLTIPAVNMTEDEHGVEWKCRLFSSAITSNGVTLYVEGW